MNSTVPDKWKDSALMAAALLNLQECVLGIASIQIDPSPRFEGNETGESMEEKEV